jgi:HTH-type transcriptional regulator / antitoxin HipB
MTIPEFNDLGYLPTYSKFRPNAPQIKIHNHQWVLILEFTLWRGCSQTAVTKVRIMIQNERQYKITRSKLKELLLDRSTLDLPSDLHPRQVLARKNSLGILIGELEQEIAEYDRLKSGQVTQFPIESLRDLPRVAIAARIAAGLTQKELAEKIGVQEQQIQRYEANNYQAVGFDRLQEVMSALDVTIAKTVMQLGS